MPRRVQASRSRPQRYDLCDGRRLARSDTPVEWWCPNAKSPNRARVLSVLPPPPIDKNATVEWRNHAWTYDGLAEPAD